MDNYFISILFLLMLQTSQLWVGVLSEAVKLTKQNFTWTLDANELVFVNFYADWCHFSRTLMPIWEETADNITREFPQVGKVIVAKVDCDQESDIAARYHISKYPTLKLFQNGQPAKREYRGQRSVDAFVTFLRQQTANPIRDVRTMEEFNSLKLEKNSIIAFMDKSRPTEEFIPLRRIATHLKDDCHFYKAMGEDFDSLHPPGQSLITFRSKGTTTALNNGQEKTFQGGIYDFHLLKEWIQEQCVPLVREITFENAEELTEEGLPFLILFHASDDIASVIKYKEIVRRELLSEKQSVNFLTANGVKFQHPLHHLGKSVKDLPVIAIDSFRHMYLFPSFEDADVPGKLHHFILDLYSGKLHREFHYGPSTSDKPALDTTPPESAFKKLAPSSNRYTILKDEL